MFVIHSQEIANLEYRFLEYLDQSDTSAVAAMFSHGTLEIQIPGRQETLAGTGESEVVSILQHMLKSRADSGYGRHIASNLIIDVDEDSDNATARMYTSLIYVAEDKPAHFMGLGRHEDELQLVEGKWWHFTRKLIMGDVRYPRPEE